MRLNYAGGTMVTTDAIAEALTEYSAALARAGTSVAIDVPGLTVEGTQGDFRLLLGPASQIIGEPWGTDARIDDAEFVTTLRAAIATLPTQSAAGPAQ